MSSAPPPGVNRAHMARRLRDRQAELISLSGGAAQSRKIVELDQQSVGRLTRQDALQQQAMAKAQDARRANELRRIAAALKRLDDGDFGWCAECGEAIAAKRLDIDPTADHCVSWDRSGLMSRARSPGSLGIAQSFTAD